MWEREGVKLSWPDTFLHWPEMKSWKPFGLWRGALASVSFEGTHNCQRCSKVQAHIEGLLTRHRLPFSIAACLSSATGMTCRCTLICRKNEWVNGVTLCHYFPKIYLIRTSLSNLLKMHQDTGHFEAFRFLRLWQGGHPQCVAQWRVSAGSGRRTSAGPAWIPLKSKVSLNLSCTLK